MFNFRLQKVLEYRKMQEEEAKSYFLECRAASLDAEKRIETIDFARRSVINDGSSSGTLGARIELEARLSRLDDEDHFAHSALRVVRDEELTAETLWRERRRDAEAIRKLRVRAFEEWQLDEGRREQNELDEWSVLRRSA